MGSLRFGAFAGGVLVVEKPGTVGLQNQAAFEGRSPLEENLHFIPAGGGEGGQADAGVAAGLLYDRPAGGQMAGGFGGLYHREGRPVLDAAGGVEELQLGQQMRTALLLPLKAVQLHQRCVAYQFLDGMYNTRHDLLPPLHLNAVIVVIGDGP